MSLLRRATEELLQRPRLGGGHALQLLASLGAGTGASPKRALEAALKALRETGAEELSHADAVQALESLARLRSAGPLDGEADGDVGAVAAVLSRRLHGEGHRLPHLLSSTRHSAVKRSLVLRHLAALWALPEAGSPQGVVAGLPLLRLVRWPKELPPGVSEETVAAAACFLARTGAWKPACGGFLLAQALRRDVEARASGGEGSRGSITPEAGALWLCAAAQAGVAIDAATDKPTRKLAEHGPEALLSAAEALAVEGAGAGSGVGLAEARALWALCALGKRAERGNVGDVLLDRLATADPAHFGGETWALLREVSATLAAGEASSAGDGAEAAEPSSAFASESWRAMLGQAATAEARRLGATGRLEQLRAALPPGARLVADGAAGGPYVVPVAVEMEEGSPGVALDLDAHQTPVNRALRRQQWPALLPQFRVADIGLSAWDRRGGADRADVVRRRLEGVADDQGEAGSED